MYLTSKCRLLADAADLSCRFETPQVNSVAAATSIFDDIDTSIFSMNAFVPCVIVYFLTVSTDAYSPGDRVSALCRTHHDGVSQ